MSDESQTQVSMDLPTQEENPTLEQQLEQMQSEDAGQEAPAESPIPEKFRNAEDPTAALAQAYAELERKMGSKDADEPVDEMRLEKIEGAQDLTADYLNELGEEYMENGGLTDESYAALAKRGITKDVVEMFVNAQLQQAESNRAQVLSELASTKPPGRQCQIGLLVTGLRIRLTSGTIWQTRQMLWRVSQQ